MMKTRIFISIVSIFSAAQVWAHVEFDANDVWVDHAHPHNPCYNPMVPEPAGLRIAPNASANTITVSWSRPNESRINAKGCRDIAPWVPPPAPDSEQYPPLWKGAPEHVIVGYDIARGSWEPVVDVNGVTTWRNAEIGEKVLAQSYTGRSYVDRDILPGWKYRYLVRAVANTGFLSEPAAMEAIMPDYDARNERSDQDRQAEEDEEEEEREEEQTIVHPGNAQDDLLKAQCVGTVAPYETRFKIGNQAIPKLTIRTVWPEIYNASEYRGQWRARNQSYSQGGTFTITGSPPGTVYHLGVAEGEELDFETEYCVQVKGCNADGDCGGWSVEACETTKNEGRCGELNCPISETIHSDVPGFYALTSSTEQHKACALIDDCGENGDDCKSKDSTEPDEG